MDTSLPANEMGTFVEMIGGIPVFRLRPSAGTNKHWYFADVDGRRLFRPDYEMLRTVLMNQQTTYEVRGEAQYARLEQH